MRVNQHKSFYQNNQVPLRFLRLQTAENIKADRTAITTELETYNSTHTTFHDRQEFAQQSETVTNFLPSTNILFIKSIARQTPLRLQPTFHTLFYQQTPRIVIVFSVDYAMEDSLNYATPSECTDRKVSLLSPQRHRITCNHLQAACAQTQSTGSRALSRGHSFLKVQRYLFQTQRIDALSTKRTEA